MASVKLFFSIFIAVIIFFFIIPSSSFAFSGSGSGTSGSPYIITTCIQLQEMSDELDATYELGSDIECGDGADAENNTNNWNDGAGFEPVGDNDTFFIGTFDGAGYTVTGLFIDRDSTDYVGLFGTIGSSGIVQNVSITDVDVTGDDYVGGLAGGSIGSISDSYTTGSVSGANYVGGLAGLNGTNEYDSTIERSSSTCDVSGTDSYIGGLVGNNGGTIEKSYATGNVSGADLVGGLAGLNERGISNVYARGDVSYHRNGDFDGKRIGGLIGANLNNGSSFFDTPVNSFSTGKVTGDGEYVGGLIGRNERTVDDSFWNTQTSEMNDACGSGSGDCSSILGKTTVQMQDVATFSGAGWDIETTDNDLNNGYPYLSWQNGTDSPVWQIYVNGGSPTPTPSPGGGNSSSSSGGSSSPSATTCSTVPSGFPDLFQINTTENTATLLFVPVGNASNYQISYGFNQEANQFSVLTDQGSSTGALSYTVNALPNNAAVYFKVYAQNDCGQGMWSNTIQVVTNRRTYFKNFISQVVSVLPRGTTVLGAKTQKKVLGQKVACTTYTVKSGDSLWSIASANLGSGAEYNSIMSSNNLSSTNLSVGQKLKVGC